ncbi:1-(5-phosphoribosyl)-5-[(5-phosphoribosylamino)methylideneamino]imidazole-4-carboxamide isomerase [Streptococcus mutans]|jgi:1-(5-phosphoribosyl)-5-[(5-phosphoribosylamino)methylideneamino]imidazole-4-carboxamide isomerase|uniref:1-(5-phosphoribosyl)-5-[(5- phosphoribosylamino)methylideneamino]imidazole-4- carboxamide isomerase n=1 Tax=Streptococcus mutans TaxID=1309 RepID=UPI0002B517F8|nr:1-(5-phosphoribosyl)-5-[(5-phosphoribosylamino)methylideneamino]imidazole-4-carboxamide isomerase [Streptococcus mutans]EMC11724.1 1-(5-phosphoribosyl)-5-[(5-phosphoribosylamino)methylideneamino] imidazole-4-carboxamide isomerase [Streptococcus mutans M2A]MDT9486621.1 1-(5-phosphoribosyl)-5-[(5-phosphoribosylamino)methylideneamino]imidazole-4-carboxamide isomerase [Streptococcus mutans]MDT9537633.1 1-(5-phosphoribosyl)-5-[(5-phosphoribosylamino)methylideneamino]imidazole-4-carboxamide isomera
MQILPAIDIKNGHAVRLVKGDFEQETVVNDNVLDQASIFMEAGIQYIHVVDLDGALEGRAANRDLIAKIKEMTGLAIEVGGGIRTIEQIEDYLSVGINRVIIGSMAVKHPQFVKEALDKFGSDKIVVGIDAKNGMVATEGWLETSTVDYISLALEMEKMGVRLFVYTDVDRDGTLTGPNFEHYEKLVAHLTSAKVIASGGIHALSDLQQLEKIGLAGTIVGKAYYNGDISLKELREFEG